MTYQLASTFDAIQVHSGVDPVSSIGFAENLQPVVSLRIRSILTANPAISVIV